MVATIGDAVIWILSIELFKRALFGTMLIAFTLPALLEFWNWRRW